MADKQQQQADFPTGPAIDKLAELGQKANAFTIQNITTPPEAKGLPASVPVGFDHRQAGGIKELHDILENWRIHPERRTGTANVDTLASFVELTNRHKSAHSVIFAQAGWPDPSLTAIIDYHEKDNGKPAFGEHRIHYAFPCTEEFKAWAGNDAKPMDQHSFAAFIEEYIATLSSATDDEERLYAALFGTKFATPADMLNLSRGLEVNVAGKVKTTTRLSSGEGEIVFTEEHLDSKGEKIVVPGLFMVHVAAFIGGQPVRLPARLRYRVSNGAVVWFYQLYKWKELLRERVVADLAEAHRLTELPSFEGSPEYDEDAE